jgi:hypothetical protein
MVHMQACCRRSQAKQSDCTCTGIVAYCACNLEGVYGGSFGAPPAPAAS